MGFEKTESAKLYTAVDGDTMQTIAERETAAGNPITWQELAKYNWGTDDPDTINELLRDELGARKRDAANNFVISADDTPRSELRIPKKFQKPALPLEKTHILRVRKKTTCPQFQACSSIPGATFETDKSFLQPSVADYIKAVEDAILEHPDAKLMIFGHTDKVGSDSYNKALSERRAKSVFAFITDDADTWEKLYKQEDWGPKSIQEILKDFDDPAFDPGPVDGIYGQKTRQAVRNFQEARGLAEKNGAAGPQTRKQLFSDYMTGKHDVKVTPEQFMEPKYMGCGERNPLKRIKDERDENGYEKDEADTEERCEENRRVTVFLFNKGRLPNLPCMIGDTEPCKDRVTPPDRLHKSMFSCSYYDSLAYRCSAEKNTPATPTQPCTDCAYTASGGSVQHSCSAVEVSHGVAVSHGPTQVAGDMIQIKVICPNNPHVLQFINREIIDRNGNHVVRQMRTTGGIYNTTTNPANPVWNTDSAGHPSPYYESAFLSCNCPGELFVWDQPTLRPTNGETWRANFRAFIICNGNVIREVRWSRIQTDGGSPIYTSTVHNTTALPQWARDQMTAQGYTYP